MLRTAARRLVNRLMLRQLPGPFVPDSGRCWVARLPAAASSADAHASVLTLYEDGVALRPARAALDDIRAVGYGAHCHRGERVHFSTTDNTDPNTNGRTYQFALSPWLYRRRVARFGSGGGDLMRPTMLRKRDARPDAIREDVAYALRVGRNYLDRLRGLIPSLTDRTVLEIGPGANCGCVFILAAYGARPLVADRFLAPWDADYHPAFYGALADELAQQDPNADVRPIRAVVQAGGYPKEIIGRFESALEEIPAPSDGIDVVLSNAVIEHLYDLEQSFAQLYRITRPGGVGLHQVDHRDHRDFGRPLEYLLMGEDEFEVAFARSHGECGNRHRPEEVAAGFRRAGFDLIDFTGNLFAEPAYLKSFAPRLRAASRSRYCDWPAEGLRVTSGFFRVRKPAGAVTPA